VGTRIARNHWLFNAEERRSGRVVAPKAEAAGGK